MKSKNEICYKQILANSFPIEMQNYVESVFEIIPKNNKIKLIDGSYHHMESLIHESKNEVILNGQKLTIHKRVYFDQPNKNSLTQLNTVERKILNCIYTRHCDGYIRQSMINQILDSNDYFVIPYFIGLIEEYVSEILFDIYGHVLRNITLYKEFIKENASYWEKVESRITSYWNEYYRNGEKRTKSNYIGFQIIKLIEK